MHCIMYVLAVYDCKSWVITVYKQSKAERRK